MQIWIDLIARDAVFLATLVALGLGPAAFLSARFDGATRLALAPAFGVCVGVVLTTTLVQYEPVGNTYWVIPPVAAVSVIVGLWRARRFRARFSLPLRELAQVGAIAVAVLIPASSALIDRGTVGPVAFNVYDAAGYVAETDAQQTRSIETASARLPPYSNLDQLWWSGYARAFQNVDVTPLEGSVDDLIGLKATDTQSTFMIVLLLVGGLGAFAAVRYGTESRSWAAALAGGLYGGPFFLQLWADSSQAAISGLALVLPFVMMGIEVLRGRGRIPDLVLFALVCSGLLSVYPLFVPQAALGSVIVLAVWLVHSLRRRRPTWRGVLAVAWRLVFVLGLAAALSPIAFGRDLRYWQSILNGTFSFVGLPVYHLPVGVLPGWILQTREFYWLPSLAHASPKDLLISVFVPVAMIVVIVIGLWRRRRIAVLLAFIAMCALLAQYVSAHNGCEYCAQRNLLPTGPMVAVLLAVGVSALWAMGTRWGRVASVVAALVIIGAVAQRSRVERERVVETAYFLDNADRQMLAHLPPNAGSVEIEGFNENIRGPGEMPLVYALVNERTGGHASIAVEAPDYSSPAYIGGAKPRGPEFDPHYRYVLTRFAGIANDRRTIARSGGIALQERTRPLDVTLVGGLGSPLARLDPDGVAWVQGGFLPEPLLVYVTGGSDSDPVWVRLQMVSRQPVAVPPQAGVRAKLDGPLVTVCVKARGTAPVRRASVAVAFSPTPGPEPNEVFQLPQPAEGIALLGVSAVTGRCVP
jgi:hypothetical protein